MDKIIGSWTGTEYGKTYHNGQTKVRKRTVNSFVIPGLVLPSMASRTPISKVTIHREPMPSIAKVHTPKTIRRDYQIKESACVKPCLNIVESFGYNAALIKW